MCGIVGVTNVKKALPYILSGLKSLEYRGYDSAGIYIIGSNIIKTTDRVDSLVKLSKGIKGSTGIGHTRWATHGKVNLENAHPHVSQNKLITLVHNGVISNYLDLKTKLKNLGYSFYGESDSEVLTNYIEYLYLQTKDIEKMFKSLKDIKGEMALTFIIEDKERIYYFKRRSPLVLAKKNTSFALASDIIALNKFDEFYFLLDDEYGYLDYKEQVIYKNNKKEDIKFNKETYFLSKPSKGHFKHFMKKEIYEEKNVLFRLKDYYLSNYDLINSLYKELLGKNVVILGCGTSFNAGSYLVNRIKNRRVKAIIASEYTYDEEDEYFIFISQSGETYDLIRVYNEMLKNKKVILITNNINSSLARLADVCLSMEAGFEVAVAATKSYISSLVLLTFLFCFPSIEEKYFDDLNFIFDDVIKMDKRIDNIAKSLINHRSLYYVGKSEGYEVMKEGALKIKEVSYLHAESIYSGELKHGPIATLDSSFAVLFLKTLKENETEANILEVKSRDIKTLVLGFDNNSDVKFVVGPKYLEYFGPIIFLQLLSYKAATLLSRDVDKPRNLAKSVTVI